MSKELKRELKKEYKEIMAQDGKIVKFVNNFSTWFLLLVMEKRGYKLVKLNSYDLIVFMKKES